MNIRELDEIEWTKAFEQALEVEGIDGSVYFVSDNTANYVYKDRTYSPSLIPLVISLKKQAVEEETLDVVKALISVINRVRNPDVKGKAILCFKKPTFMNTYDYHMFIKVSYTVHTSLSILI